MTNFEEFVRTSFDEINELTITGNTDEFSQDYLHLLNHCQPNEVNEIREIIKNIISGLERIQEIQDDCFSR